MKRRPRAHSPSTKTQSRRRQVSVKQLQERFAILLLLLQHNIDKLLHHSQTRTTRK